MKTFLLVVLILVGVVLAVNLLPFIFGLLCAIGGTLLLVALLGVGAVAALAGAALVLGLLLSPIWIPALLLAGVIALIRRLTRKPLATV
jgi:hypothetical protein